MTTQAKKKQRRRSPGFIAGLVLLFVAIVILLTLAMFTSFDEVTNVFEAGKVDIVLTETEWKPQDGDNTVPNTFIDKNPNIINKEETVNTYVFLKVTIPYDDDPNLKIEYAHQDDNTSRTSGKVVYPVNGVLNSARVPLYKFVATGKKADGTGEPANLVLDNTGGYYVSAYNSSEQKVNPGWVLVDLNDSAEGTGNPIIDETHKTFTYIYAHVAVDANENNIQEDGHYCLAEVLPGQTVTYPLFNKVYLQNFRERKKTQEVSTDFPDPTRDYSIHIEAYGIQANFLKPNNTTTRDPYDVWTNYINVSN